MAYDVLKGADDGQDWSCGIGDDDDAKKAANEAKKAAKIAKIKKQMAKDEAQIAKLIKDKKKLEVEEKKISSSGDDPTVGECLAAGMTMDEIEKI
jgi:hypothetical protein